MYKTLSQHNLDKFGCKVYKLSIDGGFTCPNRDGSKGVGGCVFCSTFGSGEFAAPKSESVVSQLERAKARVERKNKGGKYIAYFQSFSNTYAPIDVLEKAYLEAISPEYVVGISIATRPDCIDRNVVKLLEKINEIKPVTVELGLQTASEKCGEFLNRCYTNEDYKKAMSLLKSTDIETVTHIILGLPFEDETDMLATTKFAIDNKTDGVKFHLLHVLKNTKLCELYEAGEFETLSLEEYASILKKCISILPKNTVVHRITGDGDKKTLVSPLWSADKKKVLNFLNKYLSE